MWPIMNFPSGVGALVSLLIIRELILFYGRQFIQEFIFKDTNLEAMSG